ncbi:MAG: DUF6268 family outer membrane beta-barrel protein [Bacteroidota bacterium]
MANAQQYFDVLKIDHLESLGQKFDSSNARIPLSETSIDLTIPIRSPALKKNGAVLLSGLFAEHNRVRLFPGAPLTNFYSVMGKVGIVKKHGAHWTGTYLLLPKLNSDFQSIGKHDFQMGAFALLKHEKSPGLNYKFGIYANTDLFGVFIVPMFGFYILKNKLEINANLPLNLDINYQLTPNLKAGARYSGFTKTYQLHTLLPTYIEKATNEGGAYIQVKLGVSQLQFFAGTSFLRHFRTYAIGDKATLAFPLYKLGNDRTQLNPEFGNGLILKSSLIIRMPTK